MLKKNAFTLIELILVIGIFSVLVMVVAVNMVRTQTTASVSQTSSVLVADLKQQQLKAMLGNTEGTDTAQTFGIYFEPTSYTLFSGASYSAGDPANFIIKLDEGVEFSNINFPSSQIVFSRKDGNLSGYVSGSDNVTILHVQSGEKETITMNRYGVVSLN